MNLTVLLDQLEGTIDSCPRVPLTGKVLVDADEILDLLDQVRASLPEEVKRAEWIAAEKERLMQDSQDEAGKLIKQAEDYAKKLLDDNELIREAKTEAQKIVREAEVRATELTAGASDWADTVLAKLSSQLETTLKLVARGRDELARQSRPASGSPVAQQSAQQPTDAR